MNVTQACLVLEIDVDKWTKEKEETRMCILKKQYHLLALKYHQDKNKDPDANQTFLDILEAYEYLKSKQNIPSYFSILHLFLEENILHEKWTPLLEKVLNLCETKAVCVIGELSYPKFCIVYKLLTQYRHILHLSPFVYEQMEEKRIYWFAQGEMKKRKLYESLQKDFTLSSDAGLYKKVVDTEWDIEYEVESILEPEIKEEKENVLLLKPSLDDIFDQNVYKYTYEEEVYLIPLWHHELMYSQLHVKIIPNLPSTYWIDEENNLHQKIEYSSGELWSHAVREECMEIYFGKKRFVFYPHELKFKEYQVWTWKQEGISKINEQNIYDISKKGNVVLHIFILGTF